MNFELSRRQRWLCFVAAGFAVLIAVSSILLFAFSDNAISKALSEYELAGEAILAPWRSFAIGLLFVCMALRFFLFLAVARLLWILGQGDVFTQAASRAAMRVGKIQLGVALLMWLTPTLMRMLKGLGHRKLELMFSMTGPIATALLFGFVLIVLATIYRSAVAAVEENRQFV